MQTSSIIALRVGTNSKRLLDGAGRYVDGVKSATMVIEKVFNRRSRQPSGAAGSAGADLEAIVKNELRTRK